jgi:hypothetical protein
VRGALARVGDWPGVERARARALERLGALLGDEETDEQIAHGATMSYDELVQYAIEHLAATPPSAD